MAVLIDYLSEKKVVFFNPQIDQSFDDFYTDLSSCCHR